MKKTIIATLALIGFTLCISFTNNPLAEQALQTVQNEFHAGLNDLQQAILQYQQVAEQLENKETAFETLRQAHLRTRLAFKNIELFLEYYDRESVKKYLNGPPLLWLTPNVPGILVNEPVGLQVLDELVFEDNPFEQKEAILAMLDALTKDYAQVIRYQKSIPFQHRFVFEAARSEVMRIFTLGVTGFDTPGSANAIPEAYTALKAVSQAVRAYYPLLGQKNIQLRQTIQQKFNSALEYLLQHNDFENFDRLTFLKEYVNPLYSLLYQVQKTLSIEMIDEVDKIGLPVNYHAQNIFDNNFLNHTFYSNIENKELTEQRIALGRTLFFDPILSSNNERACASCHHPEKAFTDGLDKSLAINGKGKILRNSPTLINSVYSMNYFYDLREEDLERQMKHVVSDSLEFSTDFMEIIQKLEQSAEYKKLFIEAYPNQNQYLISRYTISNALSAYVTSLRSFNSPVDRYIRDEIKTIDPAVARGFNLFMGKAACGTCHFAPTFNGTVPPHFQDSESEVLGVPISKDTVNVQIDPDLGRYASQRPQDEAYFYAHSFKTVTVRNAALTAPYMHNGVYDTLEEVVDFYNKGGGRGLGLDVPYQTLPFDNLSLNQQEIKDLVKFMEALTDTTGLTQQPNALPKFENKPEWNKRQIGGVY